MSLATLTPPQDLSEVIVEIQILFAQLSNFDPAFGCNGYPAPLEPATWEGWQHPTLVQWAAARGKGDPRHDLDGPELYVLRAALQKKLKEYTTH